MGKYDTHIPGNLHTTKEILEWFEKSKKNKIRNVIDKNIEFKKRKGPEWTKNKSNSASDENEPVLHDFKRTVESIKKQIAIRNLKKNNQAKRIQRWYRKHLDDTNYYKKRDLTKNNQARTIQRWVRRNWDNRHRRYFNSYLTENDILPIGNGTIRPSPSGTIGPHPNGTVVEDNSEESDSDLSLDSREFPDTRSRYDFRRDFEEGESDEWRRRRVIEYNQRKDRPAYVYVGNKKCLFDIYKYMGRNKECRNKYVLYYDAKNNRVGIKYVEGGYRRLPPQVLNGSERPDFLKRSIFYLQVLDFFENGLRFQGTNCKVVNSNYALLGEFYYSFDDALNYRNKYCDVSMDNRNVIDSF